jgi:uracil-DNA glycosylase family 4
MQTLQELNQTIINCQRCPRLLTYCEQVAREKRSIYTQEAYWGKPVPGFGDPEAWLWIIGLAPGAHGANRTGRMFTGDRSGEFLFAALHRAGLANQPTSTDREDGLGLQGVYISAATRCAPPDNQPTPDELARCHPYLQSELLLLKHVRVLLALGQIAFYAALGVLATHGVQFLRPRPSFVHGAVYPLGKYILAASYHVSQQNTFTGKLTPKMFDDVLAELKARKNLAE